MPLPALRLCRGSALAVLAILFGLGATEVRGDSGESSDELASRLAELRRSGDCASVRRELDARFGSDFSPIPLEVVLGAGECVVEPERAVRFAEFLLKVIDRRTDTTACRARLFAARLADNGGDEAVAERAFAEILEWCPEDDVATRLARLDRTIREANKKHRTAIGSVLVRLFPHLGDRPYLLMLLVGVARQLTWLACALGVAASFVALSKRRRVVVVPDQAPRFSRMVAWVLGAWFVGIAPIVMFVGWNETHDLPLEPAFEDWNLAEDVSSILQFVVLLAAVLCEGDLRRMIRRPETGWWKVVLAATGGFAAKFVAAWTLGRLSEPPLASRMGEWDPQLTESQSGFALVLFLIVAVFPLAAIEEWFFRGWIQGRLQRAVPSVVAVMTTALLFAVFHYPPTPTALIPLFASGIIYGCLTIFTKSVWTSVLTHTAWNALFFGSSP